MVKAMVALSVLRAHSMANPCAVQPFSALGLEQGGAILYSAAMSDETPLPDRLSVNPKSPFHNAALLERGVGIRFNGADKNNVEEYCVSEGWVRLAVGKTVDRHGNAMTIKYSGVVEPYWREPE
jgi:hypothetical protein